MIRQFKNVISSFFSVKQNIKDVLRSFLYRGGEYSISTDVNDLIESGYVLNSSVNASVKKIVQAILQMNLYVTRSGDEDKVKVENQDLSLLLEYPDTDLDQSKWLESLFSYYLTIGEVFLYALTLNDKKPKKLVLLTRKELEVITKQTFRGEEIAGYKFVNSNETIDPLDILHFKMFNPICRTKGLSPILSCAYSVDLDNSAKKWNVNLLKNGVNPSGVYSTEHDLDDDTYLKIKKAIASRAGADYAGKDILLEGGLKFQQTGLSPKDADFTMAQKIAKREVASVYGIAPQLIGDTESQTFANYEQAVLSLHNDTAYPLLKTFVDSLNNWLYEIFGSKYWIEIDDSGVEALQESKKKEWARYDTSQELTINEKRALKGFEAVPQGEIIIYNGLPLGQKPNEEEDNQDDDMDEELEEEKQARRESNDLIYFQIKAKSFIDEEKRTINKAKKVMANYFEFQLSEFEKSIDGQTSTEAWELSVDSVVDLTTPALYESYKKIYADIGFDASFNIRANSKHEFIEGYNLETKCIRDIQRKARDLTREQLGTLGKFKDEYGQYVDEYFRQAKIGDLITEINNKTKKLIKNAIIEGNKEGLSLVDIQKAIKAVYKDMSDTRAETIARTETVKAINLADVESQKKIQPLSKKRWISTNDSRTRDGEDSPYNHRSVDFVNGDIPLSDSFLVSSERLEFPGDNAKGASAGNTINCRCTLGFINEEFMEFFV